RMRDERIEAAADGKHSGAREAVERASATERPLVRLGDPRSELAELLLRRLFFGVEVGDLSIERGEGERGGDLGRCSDRREAVAVGVVVVADARARSSCARERQAASAVRVDDVLYKT